MKIEWTEPALESLEGIHAFIAKDSTHYASRFNAIFPAAIL